MNRLRSIRGVSALALVGWLVAQFAAAAPLPNALQVTDNSSLAGSTLNDTTNLTVAQRTATTNLTGGFHYSVHARFVNDFSSATESVAGYDAGTHGNPAVAPSPVTQGWTETTGAGTSVGGDPLQIHDV